MSPPDTTRSITFRAVAVHLRSPQVTQSSTHQCSHERWYLVHRSRRISLVAISLNMADCKALWEAWSPNKAFCQAGNLSWDTSNQHGKTLLACIMSSWHYKTVHKVIKLDVNWLQNYTIVSSLWWATGPEKHVVWFVWASSIPQCIAQHMRKGISMVVAKGPITLYFRWKSNSKSIPSKQWFNRKIDGIPWQKSSENYRYTWNHLVPTARPIPCLAFTYKI